MLTFTQWTKTRKRKEKNNERPTSQTRPIIRHQDQQGQADRGTAQEPSEGLPVFPIVREQDGGGELNGLEVSLFPVGFGSKLQSSEWHV
jgi:hypothetical protein